MVTPLVNCSVDDVLVKVKPSLHQAFSQVVGIMNLCFIHTLLYNISNFRHMVILVHFDEAMINLMQFSW